uniref:MHC class II beta chain n=1 Tax=Crocodylus porosus TaxID=8502 RepID=A0A0B4UG79_CROPO|nr:MHC class II beta chain [Crocodylus porosus]
MGTAGTRDRGAAGRGLCWRHWRCWGPAWPIARSPPEHFLYQGKCDCLFTNGSRRVRFLDRYTWDRQDYVHFDSDVGVFVADTELGEAWAKSWNSRQAVLEDARAAADRFCRHNYGVAEQGHVIGRRKPKVKVSPTKSGVQAHPDTLICSVTGFYPGGIEVKWLRNGQEQTAGVVSTELMQNGDWTFQILVMLEMTPRSGDIYTCQVEHSSLPGPVTVLWKAQSDSARSKMLTGVGGFVLGLIFLALGLLVYLRNKKGHPVPQPTGLLS